MPKQVVKFWDKIKQAWPVLSALVSLSFMMGIAWADLKSKHADAIVDIAEVKQEIHELKTKQEVIIRLDEGQRYLIKTMDEIKNDIRTIRQKVTP